MNLYPVSIKARKPKALLPFLLFVFLSIPLSTYSQVVVTIPFPSCNANSTYNQNGTMNGKPRYLGSQEFPYEIVWTGARWECRFVNNPVLLFFNTSNTPKPPCGEWANGGPCSNPYITIISVDGVSCCTDNDGDGAGSMSCGGADCDDNDPLEKPGQIWYADSDNDGYSNGTTLTQCLRPGGYKVAAELTATTGDCNDSNPNINPSATETCNGIDDNCNGMTDEGATPNTYYRDMDGDGFGNPAVTQQSCSQPSGYVVNNTDCNDNNGAINPNTIWYLDADNDNYYTGNGMAQCTSPGAGYKNASLAGGSDCNDADNAIYPTAPDICDNKDNNCNGTTDEGGMGTPPGWSAGNVGGATNANSQFNCNSGSGSNMVFNITSQGFSGAGNADLVNSNYQQKCGNASITAHIVGNPSPGWAGIYIREDLSAGSKMVALKTNLNSFIRRETRLTTNGNKTTTQNPLYAGNTWVRIDRTGNTFSFYTSPNGTAWTFFGSSTVAMNSCVYLGLFAESINAGTPINASFDNVTITGGPAPIAAAPGNHLPQQAVSMPQLKLFPNPTTGHITVEIASPASPAPDNHYQIYDLQGQIVLQGTLLTETIDLSPLPNGVYWIRIQVDNGTPVMQKIIKTGL